MVGSVVVLTADKRQQVRAMAGAFGDRLRVLREKRGWTQRELSRRSGVPSPIISGLESGKRPRPAADTVRDLARALGVSTDALSGEASPAVETLPLAAPDDPEVIASLHALERQLGHLIVEPDRSAYVELLRISVGAYRVARGLPADHHDEDQIQAG